MPAKVAKSSVLSKLGTKLDQSVRAHAADEIQTFGQGLPPGIRGGVAKLTACRFELIPDGKKNAGHPRLVMQGVVLEPESVIVEGREEKIAGRQTWQFEPVCETVSNKGKATTLDEHVSRVVQHLGRLGGRLDPRTATGTGLEAVANALENQSLNGKPIYFHFSTSAGQEGGVFENWNGTDGLENYAEPDFAGSAVTAAPEEQATGPMADQDAVDEVDVDVLASEADGMDLAFALAPDGPGTRLLEVAAEVGADMAACKAASTWAETAELIKTADSASPQEEEQAEEPTPEPWSPKKGDPVGYRAPVKNKAGKTVPGFKVVQCEIAAINKNGTADLVQLSNKKIGWKGVKMDQLEQLS